MHGWPTDIFVAHQRAWRMVTREGFPTLSFTRMDEQDRWLMASAHVPPRFWLSAQFGTVGSRFCFFPLSVLKRRRYPAAPSTKAVFSNPIWFFQFLSRFPWV